MSRSLPADAQLLIANSDGHQSGARVVRGGLHSENYDSGLKISTSGTVTGASWITTGILAVASDSGVVTMLHTLMPEKRVDFFNPLHDRGVGSQVAQGLRGRTRGDRLAFTSIQPGPERRDLIAASECGASFAYNTKLMTVTGVLINDESSAPHTSVHYCPGLGNSPTLAGSTFVVGQSDGFVSLFKSLNHSSDARPGSMFNVRESVRWSQAGVSAVKFTGDSNSVAVGRSDGSVDMLSCIGLQKISSLRMETGSIVSLLTTTDPSVCLCATQDGTLAVVDFRASRIAMKETLGGTCGSMSCCTETQALAFGLRSSAGTSVAIRDLRASTDLATLQLKREASSSTANSPVIVSFNDPSGWPWKPSVLYPFEITRHPSDPLSMNEGPSQFSSIGEKRYASPTMSAQRRVNESTFSHSRPGTAVVSPTGGRHGAVSPSRASPVAQKATGTPSSSVAQSRTLVVPSVPKQEPAVDENRQQNSGPKPQSRDSDSGKHSKEPAGVSIDDIKSMMREITSEFSDSLRSLQSHIIGRLATLELSVDELKAAVAVKATNDSVVEARQPADGWSYIFP